MYRFGWHLYARSTRKCNSPSFRTYTDHTCSILFVQLLATTLVSAALHHPSAQAFTRQNPWLLWLSIGGSFATLFGVHFKRHEYPANMILLGAFTLFESMMIGTVTSYYSARIVLQALIITTGVFVGLTLFTFQSKVSRSDIL